MAGFLAGLQVSRRRLRLGGWRGLPLLFSFVGILVVLPQARALLTTGLLGGVVIGVCLILARHQAGPGRGTPITTLFPRPVAIEQPSSVVGGL